MQEGWSEFSAHAAKVSEFEGLDHLSESDTRAFLIDPVLRLLGYVGVGDIRREVPIKETREFLDYELRAKGVPCAIVEAKSLKASVTDAATAQCVQYAAINGVRWCVITNGLIWAIYDAHATGSLTEKRVDVVALDDSEGTLARAWAVLALLSKANMESGRGFTPLLIERVIREELTKPDSSAINALRRTLRERLRENFSGSDLAERVRQLIDSEPSVAVPSIDAPSEPVRLPSIRVPEESVAALDGTRRVRISALVRAGLLKAGEEVTARNGTLRARVRDDGKLDANGTVVQNLWDAAGAYAVSVSAWESWSFWSAPSGVPMAELRAQFVALTPE